MEVGWSNLKLAPGLPASRTKLADPNLAGPSRAPARCRSKWHLQRTGPLGSGPEPGTVARVESMVPALQALGRTPC